MTTQTEALKLALEALESERMYFWNSPEKIEKSIAAIKEVLAQPEKQRVETLSYQADYWKRMHDEVRVELIKVLNSLPPERGAAAYADRIAFEDAMKAGKGCDVWPNAGDYEERTGRDLIALYTTPPQRTWVGLTPDEIRGISLASGESLFSAIMFTHDKLKEKNT